MEPQPRPAPETDADAHWKSTEAMINRTVREWTVLQVVIMLAMFGAFLLGRWS